MAGGFVGVDLFLASGRLLGSCALSVRCGPGNMGQDTIGFEIEIEIVQLMLSLVMVVSMVYMTLRLSNNLSL